MTASEFLDAVDKTTSKATKGPWEVGETVMWEEDITYIEQSSVSSPVGPITCVEHDGDMITPRDAEFIAQSREWVPAMSAALRAVLELHNPIESQFSGETICEACSWLEVGVETDYPCCAVEAIEKHLTP